MKKLVPLIMILSFGAFMFCLARESAPPSGPATAARAAAESPGARSADDPPQSGDKGIGPAKELKLDPIDVKLVSRGKQLFGERCAACHGLDQDKTGPALGSVLKRRTPEFVMNMILNTAEMEQKNETIKKLVDKFGMPMPAPGLTAEEARAVLEYLRTTSK
jgi:mono/diheme cytochrome c family protein